ncbi:MAG TPA: GreA/GreB family elongation factor [Myxococcales bacterium]|nr:GreA/GreB family elongation factor [Myxococcales bacterium]
MSKAFTNEDAATPDVVVPPRAKAPPPETPPVEQLREQGKARLGARVALEDEDGRRLEYALVASDEADPGSGRVSVESPLGRALLGKEEGDEVVVDRPRGRAEYMVVEVRF